jgi:hypothetical protein
MTAFASTERGSDRRMVRSLLWVLAIVLLAACSGGGGSEPPPAPAPAISRFTADRAAYRVGDSPFNVITPLMAYFAVIVVFAQRYDKTAGVGTIVSLMIPYSIVILLAWTVFLVVWFVIGIPLGPGAPVHLT